MTSENKQQQFLEENFFKRPKGFVEVCVLPSDGKIMFYKRDRAEFGFLSNFFISPVFLDGSAWAHTEVYYQSQKSLSQSYRRKLQEKEKPSWSKHVGDSRLDNPDLDKRSWFLERPQDLRDDWDDIKLEVMRKAIQAKFTQSEYLKNALIDTNYCEIIEDSKSDFFWGTGSDDTGQNWLGVLLMELREQLIAQAVC